MIPYFRLGSQVKEGIEEKKPIVALETTLIAHGLPIPINLETADKLENLVRKKGAVPATIGIMNNEIIVGMTDDEIRNLAESEDTVKVNLSNISSNKTPMLYDFPAPVLATQRTCRSKN